MITTQQNEQKHSTRVKLIQDINNSKSLIVLALTGGGQVIGDLLSTPGTSATLLEATITYSPESMHNYINYIPDQYCNRQTACYMATAAFNRAIKILHSRKNQNTTNQINTKELTNLIGIGCTASLATNHIKTGEHRVHVAIQTLWGTFAFSLKLNKGERTRCEEDRLVADLILNAIKIARNDLDIRNNNEIDDFIKNSNDNKIQDDKLLDAFEYNSNETTKFEMILPLPLKPNELVESLSVIATPPIVDLFFGQSKAALWQHGKIRCFHQRYNSTDSNISIADAFNKYAEFTQAIFSGSFSPIHTGHTEMIEIAERKLGCKIAMEISIINADKPMVDYIELWTRLREIENVRPNQIVWLTQMPLFEEKSEIFRGTTFIVGADTLKRFADVKQYYKNTHHLHDVIRILTYHDCRFLVFARGNENNIESLSSLNIPDMLRSICDEIPESEFIKNISSTNLRKNKLNINTQI
jgi:nicotinic acid mononucleotide adenylyltransferase